MHKLLAGKDDESVETDFTLADTGQPIDFLRSDKMPCEVHSQLSAAGGAVKDLQTGTELSEQAPSVLDMRNRHDPQSGRVGEDGLFAEEMIPYMGADSGFSGLLICTEEALRIFEPLASRCDPMNPDPLHVIFMGRRRSPVCISAERADHILDEVLNSFDLGAQNISISFHSEYLPSESEIFPLQDSHLQKDLDLPELEIKNKFCVRGMQHGFNVVKDEHGFDSPDTQKETTGMEARPCFSPGTCVFIDTKNKIGPEDKKRLAVLSLTGAGKDTVNGSGRFFINANIHGIQE
ncbi:hypothetical protein [Desulfonatronospira thiodismutans]|nr:hypothetical protein [Desulfonatronospira thiodismutans]